MSDLVDVEGDLNRIQSLIEINRPDEALRMLSRVIAAAPDNPKAYCLAARCHGILDQNVDMVRAADQAIRCAPDNEWGYRLRSMGLRGVKRFDESIAAARVAVSLGPLAWQTQANLVEALLTVDGVAERRAAYEAACTAVSLAPGVTGTHVALGRVYASIGEDGLAHACYARALAINPTDPVTRTNMAALALRRGRLSAAGTGFREVAGENPGMKRYVDNVAVAARHWFVRAIDVGALAAFAVLLIGSTVPTATSRPIVFAVVGVYLAACLIMFARLPPPMRILVRKEAFARSGLGALGFLAFWTVLVMLNGSLSGGKEDRAERIQVSVFIAAMILIRFRRRLLRWARPYTLRRRYRSVLRPDRAAR